MKRIFVSYARIDGAEAAADLRTRLHDPPKFEVWHDVVSLKSGEDWWVKIAGAIRSTDYTLLVMTPGILESDWVPREWRLARSEGKCIMPVSDWRVRLNATLAEDVSSLETTRLQPDRLQKANSTYTLTSTGRRLR